MISRKTLICTVWVIIPFFLFTCQLFDVNNVAADNKKEERSRVSVFEGVSLSYENMSSVVGNLDSQIQDITPVWGTPSEALDVVYDISPQDEIVEIDHDSGVIKIIDTTMSFSPMRYIITATISAPYQTEITTEVFVSVLDQKVDIASKLSYTNVTDSSNKDIVVFPQWAVPLDKPSVTYSIDKALPSGMIFYETTGEIHISKEVLITDDTYTITATGVGAYYNTMVASVSIDLTAVIEGYVNEGRGETGLSNIPVVLLNENKVEIDSVNTNSKGFFTFGDISALGIYALKVVDVTEERASSIVTIDMRNFDDVPLLSIQHKRVNTLIGTTDAPFLVLGGISETPVDRDESVRVEAAVLGVNNYIVSGGTRYNISISVGVVGSSNYKSVAYNGNGLVHVVDASDIPGNAVFVEVVCYDNNNNQSIVLQPILVASTPSYQVVHSYSEEKAAPGASSSSWVDVEALTYGQNINSYGVSLDTSVQVHIKVKQHEQYNGIMLYKKMLGDASEIEYIGFSSYEEYFNDTNVFSFTDTIPSTSDGMAYVYQFRYYYYDNNAIRTYLGEKGPEILVPVMPSYKLEQQEPADYTVYDTVPSSILFEWETTYSRDLFAQVSNNTDDIAVGVFSSKDTLFLHEVGHILTYINESISKSDVANAQNITSFVWDTNTSSHTLRGNFYEWAVKSELSYDYTGSSNTYKVESKAYATYVYSVDDRGYANNGNFYLTIK